MPLRSIGLAAHGFGARTPSSIPQHRKRAAFQNWSLTAKSLRPESTMPLYIAKGLLRRLSMIARMSIPTLWS
eukprot:5702381-Amphidinium_carterae.1